MADIRFFKYTGAPWGLTAPGNLLGLWAMANDQEALIFGEPGALAILGRNVPADYFTPADGVAFCRIYQSEQCFAFVDAVSLLIDLAIKAPDPVGLMARTRAWILNALTALGLTASIEDLAIRVRTALALDGDKIVGFISPPYEENGLYVLGAVIFFSYDHNLAGQVLSAQTVDLKNISGIADLGHQLTRDQLADQLEKSFTKDMRGILVPEALDNIREDLEALALLHQTTDWIDEGII